MSKQRAYFECPNCGADVAVGAKVCRECGSDDSTGWQSSEEIDYQSIDIPDGYGPDQGSADNSAFAGSSYVRFVALVLAALLLAWVLRLL